jgi:hypothetical protein
MFGGLLPEDSYIKFVEVLTIAGILLLLSYVFRILNVFRKD